MCGFSDLILLDQSSTVGMFLTESQSSLWFHTICSKPPNYIVEFRESIKAISKFEILSKFITAAVTGFNEDIALLRHLLLLDLSACLVQRVNSVFDTKNVKVPHKLQSCSSALLVALSIAR